MGKNVLLVVSLILFLVSMLSLRAVDGAVPLTRITRSFRDKAPRETEVTCPTVLEILFILFFRAVLPNCLDV